MNSSIAWVSLDRLGDGRVEVFWSSEGPGSTVDVAWGPTPDADAHKRVETADAAAGRTTIAGLPSGPLYVSISPTSGGPAVVAGYRNLDLAGPTNFRDLGGYRGRGGATLRWGKVYRSDALAIGESGFEAFSALGLRSIYDLRSTMEVESSPNQLPPGDYSVIHIPLIGEDAVRPQVLDIADGEEFLSNLYAHILERSATVFGTVINGLASETTLPAVFHCAAGKDRTGLMAAVVLLALGVDEQVILDDYELTSQYRTSEQVASAADRMRKDNLVAAEAVAGLLRTPRWAMERSLSWLDKQYGSIDDYLTGPAGVTPGTLERMRTTLLTA